MGIYDNLALLHESFDLHVSKANTKESGRRFMHFKLSTKLIVQKYQSKITRQGNSLPDNVENYCTLGTFKKSQLNNIIQSRNIKVSFLLLACAYYLVLLECCNFYIILFIDTILFLRIYYSS